MSDVEFPEEQSFMNASAPKHSEQGKNPPGFFGVIIRFGLAKDEKGALVILSAVGVLALALTGIVLFLALS